MMAINGDPCMGPRPQLWRLPDCPGAAPAAGSAESGAARLYQEVWQPKLKSFAERVRALEERLRLSEFQLIQAARAFADALPRSPQSAFPARNRRVNYA